MKITVLIARILLGLIFFVFGLNFFFHFIPSPPPAGKAATFTMGLFGSGYFFPFLKCIETLSGLFLLINRFTAFFLIVLLPISVNIILFHGVLAHEGLPVGATVIVLNLFLCFAYRKYYSSLFTATPVI
jgi:putative oxidoreductase